MKLLIMHFCLSRLLCLLPLRSIYFPQYHAVTLDLHSSLDAKGQILKITETNNIATTYVIYMHVNKDIFTHENYFWNVTIYKYIHIDFSEEITASIFRVLKLQEYVQIGTGSQRESYCMGTMSRGSTFVRNVGKYLADYFKSQKTVIFIVAAKFHTLLSQPVSVTCI
jgi:hypothetical protein